MSACDLSVKHLNELIPIQAVKMEKKKRKTLKDLQVFHMKTLRGGFI